MKKLENKYNKTFLLAVALFLAGYLTASANAQVATSKWGLGGKVGSSIEADGLGSLVGGEMYYRSGSFQYELFSTSSSVNLKHRISKEIAEADVFTASTPQGTLDEMNAAISHSGLQVRWFLSGSRNIGFGYSQYEISVPYKIVSDDTSETYENTVTGSTSAMLLTFCNQWKLFNFAYFGIDWITSFIPTALEIDALTQSNADAPTDAGNVKANDKLLDKIEGLTGKPANFISMSFGVEF